MALTVIVAVILGYFLVMLIVHELFRKFFHMLLFVTFIAFAVGVAYMMLKGGI
ncbi:hypothetical protein HYS31_04560 [Candidatus Woesearchaeota archaeon]|nr:hypothetical protein [Candidatus Woesearchaeota archaeon]